jgi:peptidyl-prolyl cis-trans isomerase SurA
MASTTLNRQRRARTRTAHQAPGTHRYSQQERSTVLGSTARAIVANDTLVKRPSIGLFSTLIATFLFAVPARAVVVERVVAVVGERPILLSELRHRAKTHLILAAMRALEQGMPAENLPTMLAGAEPKAMKETLDEIIDERLMEQQADKAHLSVSVDEVDRGIHNKAQQLGIADHELWTRAKTQGYTEQDYRDEVRRQLLEGKLLQLRLAGRIHVTESDARATYDRLIKNASEDSPVDLQVVYMKIPQTAGGLAAKEALAQQIVMQARSGATGFCDLVKQYNDDVETQNTCGSRGPVPMRNVIPAARRMLETMREGDISDPIRIGDQVVIVFKLAKRDKIPPFEQVKDQMADQALEEAILQQRAAWVKELRGTVFLDIKL